MSLEVQNINFEYLTSYSNNASKLFENVNFRLEKSSCLHLCGQNGSGKTTLLKIIAGLIRPDSGQILFNNLDVYHDLATYQENICYVGHKLGISLGLTVMENCRFDLKLDLTSPQIIALLETAHLTKYKDTRCILLSSGLQRRVALLKLFISQHSLWILDEPLVALDITSVAIFKELVKKHIANGGMLIYTSHQPIDFACGGSYEYFL
jgi:heme exporter protein A